MAQLDVDLAAWLSDRPTGEALTSLAMADPLTVTRWCSTGLSTLVEHLGASHVWQARGLAARQRGDTRLAVRYLRRAVVLADARGDLDRAADVRATLAATLALVGRPREALALLEQAEAAASAGQLARIQMRKGAVLGLLGRPSDSVEVLGAAVVALRSAGDVLWEARALNNRAIARMELGATRLAAVDARRSQELYSRIDQGLEAGSAIHNLGYLAFRFGDIPQALDRLAQAGYLLARAGAPVPEVAIDRSVVLLAAGLPDEAYQQIEACLASFGRVDARSALHAEALLVAARAALAAGRPDRALECAGQAQRLFTRQGNRRAATLARLEGLRARRILGAPAGPLLRSALILAGELEELAVPESVDARLLAGRVALDAGRAELAQAELRRAAGGRLRGPALARATGWLAQELAEQAAGSRRGVLRAAGSGLRAVEQHRLTLGSTELRAHATSHGAELVAGALRQVVDGSDPRQLLAWSERWRAMTVDALPSRPPDSPQALADLGELREVSRMLTGGAADRSQAASLMRRQRALEAAVLANARQARAGSAAGPVQGFDLGRLFEALAGRQLVSVVEVDGVLHALLVSGRRVRRFHLGAAAAAAREVEFARFGLRAAVLGRGGVGAAARLAAAAQLLQQALLGPVVAALDDSPLVLVPPTRLQATPWALLPALADRAFTVAPSARAWVRARATPAPPRRRVVLVRGPGMASEAAEVPVLAELHPGAVLLADDAAGVEATLDALDGAWLGHVAAHGTFRADNPMFSSLQLADGPLTIHDLERLRRPPHRLVLSACDAGLGASVGADELLGLVSALMAVGSAGVLAAVLPVADTSVVELSVLVHRRLLAADDLAEAARAARGDLAGDPVAAATAAAFLAFGAA